MFDLPEPLGPTTAVMPGRNSKTVRVAKVLKPWISRRLRYTALFYTTCAVAGFGEASPPNRSAAVRKAHEPLTTKPPCAGDRRCRIFYSWGGVAGPKAPPHLPK